MPAQARATLDVRARERLGCDFFARDTTLVARELVGAILEVREGRRSRLARIVETEAYCGADDLACHARFGKTARTAPLFGTPGTVYVFLVYGMHECMNFVTREPGAGEAVLVRAVEPITALESATNGPGKLTKALGITRADNLVDACAARSRIRVYARTNEPKITVSARVGVGYAGEWADRAWRFFDAESAFVSRPPRGSLGRPPSD